MVIKGFILDKDLEARLFIVAACSEQRLMEVISDLRSRGLDERLTVLIANVDLASSPLRELAEVFVCAGDSIEICDFKILQGRSFTNSLLLINHVIRPNYKNLVEATVQRAESSFLYTFNGGFQNLDIRDSYDDFDGVEISTLTSVSESEESLSLFFRPSDQTMKRFEKERLEQGIKVLKVDSLAEFEKYLASASEVFFNWCITDYVSLKLAFDLSLKYSLKRTGYITVDLVDLAEDEGVKEELEELNRSMISKLDFCYVMSTRQFFVDRYKIDRQNVELTQTLAGEVVEKNEVIKGGSTGDELQLFYHGMMYYWHELDLFMSIFLELRKLCKVRLTITGRVHESVKFLGRDLFPKKEQRMREALKKYLSFPEVDYLGFTSIENVNKHLCSADYFVGLTAGDSLMAQTEFRTGVVEALAVGSGRLLHKETMAFKALRLEADKEYLAVSSQAAKESAQKIYEDWKKTKKSFMPIEGGG